MDLGKVRDLDDFGRSHRSCPKDSKTHSANLVGRTLVRRNSRLACGKQTILKKVPQPVDLVEKFDQRSGIAPPSVIELRLQSEQIPFLQIAFRA